VLRRLVKNRYVLPAAVLVAVGLGSVAGLASMSGAAAKGSAASSTSTTPTTIVSSPNTGKAPTKTAGATRLKNTHPTTATATTSCEKAADQIGYTGPADDGSPSNSTSTDLLCIDGKVVQYGDTAITYTAPPESYITAGHKLFEQNCSSCHETTAQGSAAAPNLRGVGPATVNFWVTTGRMPAATTHQIQAQEKPPRLTDRQANEIAAWINSLSPAAPYIPTVHLKGANLTKGQSLFALNCAACHTITGAGDALAYGTQAPTLHNPTPRQVAEAIRTGPGNMPRFTGNMSDAEVRDIVAYVTEKIEHPTNNGGFGLGGVGPVAEGFIALLFGVGGLMLVCFWIGDRS
jgi:ubiquinol-cytochrome c reductase cytochrome c subunit